MWSAYVESPGDMEIDRVDELITTGWALVRRVGGTVARTIRTAIPTG